MLLSLVLPLVLAIHAGPLRFVVEAPGLPVSHSLAVVYLSKLDREPRFGPNWFNPQPCYSVHVPVESGTIHCVVDDYATGFPGKLSALVPGEYTVQAVLDRNLGGRAIGSSPGNYYSKPVQLTLDPATSGEIVLNCDQLVAEPQVQETDRIKQFQIQSPLLTKWYGRPTNLTGAVLLPEDYNASPTRRFPVIYEVPGFGGTPYQIGANTLRGTKREDVSFIEVVLDPDCPTGHCVFADSANNGPWGTALTSEFIPALEKEFRSFDVPETRFVTGHSSGGWSSLWLQVAYPDVFGSVWSTSPDPVDFRDFQRIDLYKPGVNMFTDEAGSPRPLARRGDSPVLFYKAFSDMERPIRGEQLGSFEGVFSPRGKYGQPEQLWNRDTGAVDHHVAEAWRKYDIDAKLQAEWPRTGPKLKGKLHVFTGDKDTFYLEGAVRLLKADMAAIGSDAEVEIGPGDHSTMMTPELRAKIDHEMADTFLRWQAAHPPQN